MAVTITLDDNTVDALSRTVDALYRAVEDLDAELDGWYPPALDVLVRSLDASDTRQRSRPMIEES